MARSPSSALFPLFLERVPLLKQTAEKRNGALILTCLLEDLGVQLGLGT